MKVACSTLRGYLQGVSGLFITKDNPGGLTPKELDILTALIFILEEESTVTITAEVKSQVASMTNHPIQVITNYVKKLRDKNVLTKNNTLHPVLKDTSVIIEYRAKAKENKDNV